MYLYDRYEVIEFAFIILMVLCGIAFYLTQHHYYYISKEMVSKREFFEQSGYINTEVYGNLENQLQTQKKYIKKSILVFVLSGLIVTMLPSRNGFLALTGIYVGSQIYDKVDKSEIFDKSVKLLNLELNNKLDELIQQSTNKKDKTHDTDK